MTKTAVAFRHVHFEDLGAFEAPLRESGYAIRYCDVGLDRIDQVGEPDLVIVLGGPIGAFEDNLYPFLVDEIAMLKLRLSTQKPTLGICLGAQLMARALGAKVYPARAKEIGWSTLTISRAGRAGPLRHFFNQPVLHWHGDQFDLPAGTSHLAATSDCDNQAFAYGSNAIAFQFHPEAAEAGFERWLVGHAIEIGATPNASIAALRISMRQHGANAAAAGRACLNEWLLGLR